MSYPSNLTKEEMEEIQERMKRIDNDNFQGAEIIDFNTRKVVNNIEEMNAPIKKFTRFEIMDI